MPGQLYGGGGDGREDVKVYFKGNVDGKQLTERATLKREPWKWEKAQIRGGKAKDVKVTSTCGHHQCAPADPPMVMIPERH